MDTHKQVQVKKHYTLRLLRSGGVNGNNFLVIHLNGILMLAAQKRNIS